MVDLRSQYLNIKEEVDSEIQKVIDNASFINGSIVSDFRKNLENYLGVKSVIPCANGTDALQIAMMSLGLKPGDEVITVDFTFVATVEVIALLGLKPVLVDINRDTFLIDTNEIENAITTKTKAIVPVHLFGQCANMEEILQIAQKYNLFVIEDAAQATGAEFTFSDGKVMKAGTMGDFGTTSFFPSKNLGCYGDGGALFSNNEMLAEKARAIVNHGMKVRYHHDLVGVNSRLDSIQAAVLNVKLKYLDLYNDARRRVADYYDSAFANIDLIETPFRSNSSKHIFHQYTLRILDGSRNELQRYLAEQNIPSMVYYPVPCHNQNAFQAIIDLKEYPITDMISNQVLSLPIHTEMNEEQLKYISDSVIKFFNKKL